MADWTKWELEMLKTDKSAAQLSTVMNHSISAIKRRRYELTGSYFVDADLNYEEPSVLGSCGPGSYMTKADKIARIYNMAHVLGVKIK